MNINHPLKYKYFTYRKPYLIYIVLFFIFLMASILSFRDLNDFYKYLSASIILITFIFTVINSVYEFTVLATHYLSLKTIKIEYLISSIIYSVINTIIQISLILISYLIIESFNPDIQQVFALNSFAVYSFTFVIHLAIFSVIGLMSLFLKKVKYIQIALYLAILLIVALISLEITNSIIEFVYNLYADNEFLLRLNPIIIIITILIWIIIYKKIKIAKK